MEGAAALGIGNAYVWRGAWLLEIVYNDDRATPDALDRDSKRVLGPLVKSIAAKVPGATEPPPEVALLPSPDRIPMGVRYRLAVPFPGLPGDPDEPPKDAVGGAVGYYASSGKRYRVTIVDLDAEADAKKLGGEAAKQPGDETVAAGDEAYRYAFKEGALTGEVVVARKGDRLVAVWDELRVLRGGMPEDERAKLTLTAEEKKDKALAALSASP